MCVFVLRIKSVDVGGGKGEGAYPNFSVLIFLDKCKGLHHFKHNCRVFPKKKYSKILQNKTKSIQTVRKKRIKFLK